jgi:hypothetical protein
MEQRTVEVTFEGKEVSSASGEYADMSLYRHPDGRYLVYLDARKAGDDAVLETGHYPHRLSEGDVRFSFSELLEPRVGR